MLIIVQSVQIARASTTFEAMRSYVQHEPTAAGIFTTALVTGAIDTAGVDQAGAGNEPSQTRATKGSCIAQWKRLLGLDTFMATAQGELKADRMSRRRNMYSRGALRNCVDFWCDPAPIFGRRPNGSAMLDGVIVNYASMYESPGLDHQEAESSERLLEEGQQG